MERLQYFMVEYSIDKMYDVVQDKMYGFIILLDYDDNCWHLVVLCFKHVSALNKRRCQADK